MNIYTKKIERNKRKQRRNWWNSFFEQWVSRKAAARVASRTYDERLLILKQKSNRTKYRSYTFEDLRRAYDAVKNDSMPIRKAARTFHVPEATLRHRVHGKVDMDCVNSGPRPLFSRDQEINLIQKLKHLVAEGTILTQTLVCDIATLYAVELGLRSLDDPLSKQWFIKFRGRWGSDVYDLFKVSTTENNSLGVEWNS